MPAELQTQHVPTIVLGLILLLLLILNINFHLNLVEFFDTTDKINLHEEASRKKTFSDHQPLINCL